MRVRRKFAAIPFELSCELYIIIRLLALIALDAEDGPAPERAMSHLAADAGSKFGWEGMAATPPFIHADPTTEGWTRSKGDPHVQARIKHLASHGGIKGLEVCRPDADGKYEVERVVRLFLRDGFVAVADVLEGEQLTSMQAAW